MNVATLSEKCAQFSKKSLPSNDETSLTLEERLKALINRAQLMVFMKGERDEPRCGFSKQIVDILDETG